MKSVTGAKAGESARAYVSQASYDSGGGLDRALLGNGRWEDWDYNERKQVVSIKLGSTQGAGDLLTLGFGYGTTNNNGNVLSQTIVRPGFSATQTYTYDAYNRIQKVQEGTEFRDFAYKEPGNLYVPSWSTGAGWAPGSFTPASPSWFDGNNRLVNAVLGIQYDAAGNLTAIGGFTFAYDAESRLVSSTLNSITTNYVYDGEGRRVKKTRAGQTTAFVYDGLGRLAAEYGGTAALTGTVHLVQDHLGNVRLLEGENGVVRRYDYKPFGEALVAGVNGRATTDGYESSEALSELTTRFTGKERDQETGLDYFGARYFSGAQGRFTSVDPAMESADPSNPQSWNRYTYALNNPLRYKDPDGRIPVETFLDLASLGKSLWDFARGPSWAGAGYVAWDAASVALPYVPGSWVRRVAELGHAGLEAAKGVVRFENALEIAAAKRYLSEGVGLLGAGDDQVRSVLGLSRADKAADFLGVTQSGKYILGEAKGSDLASAVSQLDNTAKALLAKQGDVKFSAEVVLKRGQPLDPRFRVSGTQLQRQVWNEKKRIWEWELQKAQGQAINVRYVD